MQAILIMDPQVARARDMEQMAEEMLEIESAWLLSQIGMQYTPLHVSP